MRSNRAPQRLLSVASALRSYTTVRNSNMNASSSSEVGMSKWALDTPCLVLDRIKFERNLKAMQEHANRHEKGLRPHAKTHKCSRIAQEQVARQLLYSPEI